MNSTNNLLALTDKQIFTELLATVLCLANIHAEQGGDISEFETVKNITVEWDNQGKPAEVIYSNDEYKYVLSNLNHKGSNKVGKYKMVYETCLGFFETSK